MTEFLKENLSLIIPIVGIISGWVGYKIKAFIDRKELLFSKASEERRKIYQDFIDLIVESFKTAGDERKQRETLEESKGKLYDFYKKYVLYASPPVIKSYGNLMQLLYENQPDAKPNTKDMFKHLGEFIKVMRDELGLSNKDIESYEFFKPILRDYNKLFQK